MEESVSNLSTFLLAGGAVAALLVLVAFIAILFRRVVSTNEVHIVQSAKKTTSYGKDTENGNSYYEWPSWIPVFGITKIVLPVSVFDLDLENYEAYDKGRLPFSVDVKAFFRVSDSNLAAQRVSSFDELHSQLKAIVQGAVRVILASNDIEEIMQGRSKFGDEFTKEVNEQLANWGVITVKNIELMDLRDGTNGRAIHNIMEKKKSHIEMESRIEVAKNNQAAQIAEVEAVREVDLQKQQAQQAVGLRTVENQRQVNVSQQEAQQAIKEAEAKTKEKEMAVVRVQSMRAAEINKETALVKAEQDKQTAIIKAQQDKESTVLVATGRLDATKLDADGISATGKAKAAAEQAILLAPVEAQITLAKEIGNNQGYQTYLVTLRKVEAEQAVGIAQAEALSKADVKVIANTGNPTAGVSKVMDLFSSKGGTELAGMVEAFAQSDAGKSVLTKLGVITDTSKTIQ